MKTYSGDPYWMTAKFPGTCAKTGVPFKRGDRVFYYPRDRKCYVGEAAEAASRDFEACAQDEAFASGDSW
jgi:hypothetical protein